MFGLVLNRVWVNCFVWCCIIFVCEMCWKFRFLWINFLERVECIELMYFWILDLDILKRVESILFDLFFFNFIRKIVKLVCIDFVGVGWIFFFMKSRRFLKEFLEIFMRLWYLVLLRVFLLLKLSFVFFCFWIFDFKNLISWVIVDLFIVVVLVVGLRFLIFLWRWFG